MATDCRTRTSRILTRTTMTERTLLDALTGYQLPPEGPVTLRMKRVSSPEPGPSSVRAIHTTAIATGAGATAARVQSLPRCIGTSANGHPMRSRLLATEFERQADLGAVRNDFTILNFQILRRDLGNSQIFKRRTRPLDRILSRVVPRSFTGTYNFNYLVYAISHGDSFSLTFPTQSIHTPDKSISPLFLRREGIVARCCVGLTEVSRSRISLKHARYTCSQMADVSIFTERSGRQTGTGRGRPRSTDLRIKRSA